MSELQSFNDPLLAEWLGAVERDMGWAVNASPVLLAKGLSDGSLRETWKRKESRLPKIDDTRHQMWAREFLAMADRKMRDDGDCRMTIEAMLVERLDSMRISRAWRTLGPRALVEVSLSLNDSSLGRVFHCHSLLAEGRGEQAARVARELLKGANSAETSKCLLQVLGMASADIDEVNGAFDYYQAADELAVNSRLPVESLVTSRFNMLNCGLTIGCENRSSHAIDLVNELAELDPSHKRRLLTSVLFANRVELTLDLRLTQSLEPRMSAQTLELIHEVL